MMIMILLFHHHNYLMIFLQFIYDFIPIFYDFIPIFGQRSNDNFAQLPLMRIVRRPAAVSFGMETKS